MRSEYGSVRFRTRARVAMSRRIASIAALLLVIISIASHVVGGVTYDELNDQVLQDTPSSFRHQALL